MKKATFRSGFDGDTYYICPYCKEESSIYELEFNGNDYRCPCCSRHFLSPFFTRHTDSERLNKGHRRFSLFNLYIKVRRYLIRRFR